MSTLGDFDTEDNFSCAITFPNGTASAHLSWTAGVRKVIYTIHGERGAIRVEDDDVEVAVMSGDADEGPMMWEMKKQKIASEWMDASHVGWFRSLFDQFATAIARDDFVGQETEASVRCIELITTAYASARDRCVERSRSAGEERVIDLAFSLGLTMATLVVAVAYAGRVSRAGAARERARRPRRRVRAARQGGHGDGLLGDASGGSRLRRPGRHRERGILGLARSRSRGGRGARVRALRRRGAS